MEENGRERGERVRENREVKDLALASRWKEGCKHGAREWGNTSQAPEAFWDWLREWRGDTHREGRGKGRHFDGHSKKKERLFLL